MAEIYTFLDLFRAANYSQRIERAKQMIDQATLTYSVYSSDDAKPFPRMLGKLREISIPLAAMLDEDVNVFTLFSKALGGEFDAIDGDMISLFGRIDDVAVHLLMNADCQKLYFAEKYPHLAQ